MPGPGGSLSTSLTDTLAIRHPVLLAPMGDSAGGRLAAAVSEAGGFGLVGGGYGDPAWLERELALAGDARVGVGFITFALDRGDDALDVALRARVPAVQLSFGDPRPYAARIRDAGALLVCQVQSTAEIDQAMGAGADVLVVQGSDAGGHGRPGRATMALVPSVVDRVGDVPVVAAGGIADGRGLAAVLALGGAGVSIGTRFLASREALSTPAEAAALVAGHAEDTVRTPVFDLIRGPAWPDGYDGRALANGLVRRWHDRTDEIAAREDELRAAYRATPEDDLDTRAVWAGEGLDLIDSIEPAADIVADVVDAACRRLLDAAARVTPSDGAA